MATTSFNAEVDRQVWDGASAVLAADNLTVSDAFHRMLTYIASEGRLPFFECAADGHHEPDGLVTPGGKPWPRFSCFTPNEKTVATMEAAERGELVTIGSVDDLIAELNSGDDDDEDG